MTYFTSRLINSVCLMNTWGITAHTLLSLLIYYWFISFKEGMVKYLQCWINTHAIQHNMAFFELMDTALRVVAQIKQQPTARSLFHTWIKVLLRNNSVMATWRLFIAKYCSWQTTRYKTDWELMKIMSKWKPYPHKERRSASLCWLNSSTLSFNSFRHHL